MYANYCLHKFNMLPSTFVELGSCEKAFIIASIQLKVESDKRERDKIRKK